MTKLPKNKVPVSVGIPFNLLLKIDEVADQDRISRSELIVQILKEKFKNAEEQK